MRRLRRPPRTHVRAQPEARATGRGPAGARGGASAPFPAGGEQIRGGLAAGIEWQVAAAPIPRSARVPADSSPPRPPARRILPLPGPPQSAVPGLSVRCLGGKAGETPFRQARP